MKHDHKKTKKLKVALFAMVMFLPFIAIGVTCATHIFNKEVTEETETATINYMYETNEVNTKEDLINNNAYLLTINTNDYQTATFIQAKQAKLITDVKNINVEFGYATYTTENTEYTSGIFNIIINYRGTHYGLACNNFYFNSNYQIDYINDTYTNTLTIMFVYSNTTTWTNELNTYNFTISKLPIENNTISNVNITTNPQDQTTNIFYDSCNQVQDSFILNWCEQANPVRGPIQSFTTAFSLPNEHIINTLITYWICIAMIYIVIDIIAECVIMITHFFNKEF